MLSEKVYIMCMIDTIPEKGQREVQAPLTFR
jgi:hypothetical protein